jgi:DNA-binding transcriptional LysR family regulator
LTVAREGSFSRAAARLHRTQPAVSQAVRKLEGQLGEVLFDRSSRDGRLTDAGRLLYDYAEKLLNLRLETFAALGELREMQRGKLLIAANEYTCLYLLPVLDRFRRLSPMITVTVQRALACRIPDEVRQHGVELGILSYRPSDPGLRSIVVYHDQLAFVVHPRHPLAAAEQVSIEQLGAESFIAHQVPSPNRDKVLQAFKRHKTPLNMAVELPTLEGIKKFLSWGNGVALVPELCVADEVARGELVQVPVRDLRLERKIRLIYRRNASLSHAARAFLNVARSMTGDDDRYLYRPERGR